jgi:hypothetical protein
MMSKHPNLKFAAVDNIRSGIRNLANRLGLRTGFPTDADRAALPYVIQYRNLSRELLGDRKFERVYHSAINAAVHIAGRLGYLAEPIRDNRCVLVCREFRFATKLKAVQFRLHVDAALAGRPLLLTEVAR